MNKRKNYKYYTYCFDCQIQTLKQNWKEHSDTRKHIINQQPGNFVLTDLSISDQYIHELITSDILTDNEEMDNKKRKCEEF